jgi:hypothetical protein
MTTKIHTQFDPETNARLDQLFADWTFADNRADRVDYTDLELNDEADHWQFIYDAALTEATAKLIKTADAPEFANLRICDVLAELEKQADSWQYRHTTGYKLALQAVEAHKQALAEREAKINALTAKKPRLGAIVAERETGDDGQWANWDESSPVYGLSW